MDYHKLINRQWILKARPTHELDPDHFEYKESEVTAPRSGEILLKTHYLNIAPVMRMYMMADGGGYSTERILNIGDVIHGRGVAEVVASNHPSYRVGDFVHGQVGWQSYKLSVVSAKEKWRKMTARQLPIHYGLSALGMTGYSAYCGFMDRGQPKPGEAVLISGAAGGVGSLVVQIAKAMGCSPVVGIAGGQTKCDVTLQLGADAMIDYKNEDVEERIGELLPDGFDVFFDNVGGDILNISLNHMSRYARIVLCGGISEYAKKEPFGPVNYGKLRMKGADMKGFFVYYHADQFNIAEEKIAKMIHQKQLKVLVDIVEGFEHMPASLIGMYHGTNIGKRIVKVDSSPEILY